MLGSQMMTSREIFQKSQEILTQLLICDFGIPYLDDALNGMLPGTITLVGARSGGGKTEFATQVILAQQSEESKRMRSTLYFALDHEDGEIEKRVLWRLLVDQIYKATSHPLHGKNLRYVDWATGKYSGLVDDFEKDARTYYEHLFAISETRFFYTKNELTAHDVATIIRSGEGQQFNLFVVDHFHALKDIDSLEKQTTAIATIAKAAEESFRPVLILGQFRKRAPTNKSPIPEMEEFSGSSQLLYIPQNIVVLAPKYTQGDSKYQTYFHVVKSRLASDAKPFVGVHSFDIERKKYSEKYEVMKYVPFAEPEPVSAHAIPKWAKRAVSTSYVPQQPILKRRYAYKYD